MLVYRDGVPVNAQKNGTSLALQCGQVLFSSIGSAARATFTSSSLSVTQAARHTHALPMPEQHRA